jgi:NAD(P)-dependent dehydrogenase (short-subunit alcohol dehydrogenase family)
MVDLKGKIAIVTGGSSGIGYAIADRLLQEGMDVVICGRRVAETQRAAKILADTWGANCLGIPCDVTERDQVAELVKFATENGSEPLHLLVNNAGVARFAPIREMTPELFEEVLAINLLGPFNLLHAALPHLVEGSWVINIGSLSAVNSYKTGAAYNASKAGLLAFMEAVMQDLREEGVRVTSILSGSVNTRLEGPDGRGAAAWKMEAADIAQVVADLLKLPPRALPSRIDIRPTRTS